MDYTGRVTLTIAVGVVCGLFYSRRTGWDAGGLITPGLLALVNAPGTFGALLAISLALAVILRGLVRRFALFGRERVGAALLLALIFRIFFREGLNMDVAWIGWLVPGLIAADIERQGVLMTMTAVVSVSLATVFFASLIFRLSGG